MFHEFIGNVVLVSNNEEFTRKLTNWELKSDNNLGKATIIFKYYLKGMIFDG